MIVFEEAVECVLRKLLFSPVYCVRWYGNSIVECGFYLQILKKPFEVYNSN